ncbi:MAG: UbiA family prenyltransferase [Phycisphaerae bacterium]|nr:UbiA family prenyltransferase [Phycisphaerae bacterium]
MSLSKWVSVFLDLGKFRTTVAVTLTTGLGYFMARRGVGVEIWKPLLGTLLLAAGASALNQCQEVALDSRMERTRRRPIPAGHIDRTTAVFLAALTLLGGLYVLTSIGTHAVQLLVLSVLAVAWYNGLYTYLKRVTAFAVVPGAVIGAIPPVIGFVAAGGDVSDPVILLVAGFLFIWQVPHFWLLMLLLEDQYVRAGLPTLGRSFSRPQLHRVTFMWVLAAAVSGMAFPAVMRGQMRLPWNVVIVLASCWLVTVAMSVLLGGRAAQLRAGAQTAGGAPVPDRSVFRKAFVRINIFALVFVVSLSLNVLGLSF